MPTPTPQTTTNLSKVSKHILTQAQYNDLVTAGLINDYDEYYITDGSPSVVWGAITGTLASQTDLQNALNAKSTVSGVNDGTNWTSLTIDGTTKAIPQGGGGGGSSTLAGLSDVTIANPSAGQPLQYDSVTGKWVNASQIAANTIPTFSSAVIGQVLTKDTNNSVAFATITGAAPAYIAQTGIEAPESDYYTKGQTDALLAGKQETLVSGTNIKTLNSTTLLGSGNISIPNLSFHHITANPSSNAVTFDDTLTGGYNRCYARSTASANFTLHLAFTNTDEHYIMVYNSGSAAITVAVTSAGGTTVVGNTAIEIAASNYYEISFLKSSTNYILTERKLTTA